MPGFEQCFQGQGFVHFPPQHFQAVARPAHQSGEAGEGKPIDQQHVQHAGINGTASADHWLGMLGAEKPNREIDQGNVEGAKDSQTAANNGVCPLLENLRRTR